MRNRIFQTVFLLLFLWMYGTGCRNAVDSGSLMDPEREVRAGAALSIQPGHPYTTDTLHVVLENGSLSGWEFEWTRNGRTLPVNGNELAASSFSRGDTIRVKAVSPGAERVLVSDPVVVVDSPPVIQEVAVRIESGPEGYFFRAGVRATDADQDTLVNHFEWWVNGKKIKGSDSDRLPIGTLKRGDCVQVRVLPDDGTVRGLQKDSSFFRVPNTPPRIVSEAPARIASNGNYEYQVQAVDRDRDPLRFSLRQAPEEMRIQPDTGRLVWETGGMASGPHKVVVTVSDGVDETDQVFTITLNRKAS